MRAVLTKPFAVADLEAVIKALVAPSTDPTLRSIHSSSGGLCSLCLESFEAAGMEHWLSAEAVDAAGLPSRKCPTCARKGRPRCRVGPGRMFYVCEACGQAWRADE